MNCGDAFSLLIMAFVGIILLQMLLAKIGGDKNTTSPKASTLNTAPLAQKPIEQKKQSIDLHKPARVSQRVPTPQSFFETQYHQPSPEQREILDFIEDTNKHVFISGQAGTGKSFLLHYLTKHSEKEIAICAPTGVAALRVGGQTIHSLFRIKPADPILQQMQRPAFGESANVLKRIDTLVIDEISMVRADLMDAIDTVLRFTRNSNKPFGGVQIIMFGDLYQLPPIVKNTHFGVPNPQNPQQVTSMPLPEYFHHFYGGSYFFHADVWKNARFERRELTTIFRQKDRFFQDILNQIRQGRDLDAALFELNKRVVGQDEIDDDLNPVTLATTRRIAEAKNAARLNAIPSPAKSFYASYDGDTNDIKEQVEHELTLKIGAQVMFTANDIPDDATKTRRWVNGTVGIIRNMKDDLIMVMTKEGLYSVDRKRWENQHYFYDPQADRISMQVVGTITQFPLKLAWALTIHKAQGQDYDSVIINMGTGAFACGQTYVALSRCRNLETLHLETPLKTKDILISPEIYSFLHPSVTHEENPKPLLQVTKISQAPSASILKNIASINAAIRSGESMEIDYMDTYGNATSRIITPIEIIGGKSGNIVIAYCHLRNEERHFRIDRIAEIRNSDAV